eukprot:CAMPEP_0201480796 /NCGR_PEP_ID=MMETSP0151_2-20130828/5206_1 /ASSEMBLY_ACC=CAM_ASM_000257 /TAXON_ID=200890 /ORGANISM="Paramoeba atlantica, Strain 621/1 / CCAP 1560/9" /LENGTH=251 /DNA_ID=CAMNT_0047862765 /DNA_START=51 /DNA_END=806 /DNA_ORIENTATION=+
MTGTGNPCCPTNVSPIPVSKSDHALAGEFITFNEVKMYVTGEGRSAAIVVTYDIFGYHPCTLQICDRLSQCTNYTVVVPDFFEGKSWPMEPWPLEDFKPLLNWIEENGKYEHAKPKYIAAVDYCERHSVRESTVYGLGMCWGAKVMMGAQRDGFLHGCAAVHPSFLDVTDARTCNAPLCVLTSKDEPSMKDIQDILSKKPFSSKNIWKRFDTMHHGFFAARRDPKDASQSRCADEVLDIIKSFFCSQAPDA